MKKYQLLNWGIVVSSFVFTIFLILMAPHQVVMHFNSAGFADSWSNGVGLLLEPILLLVFAWFCNRVSRSRRRRDKFIDLPMITFGEWRLLAASFVILIVFSILQLYQIGLLR